MIISQTEIAIPNAQNVSVSDEALTWSWKTVAHSLRRSAGIRASPTPNRRAQPLALDRPKVREFIGTTLTKTSASKGFCWPNALEKPGSFQRWLAARRGNEHYR